MENDLVGYISELEKRLSPSTIKRVKSQLNKFIRAVKFQKVSQLDNLELSNLEHIALVLRNQNESPMALYNIMREAKNFIGWKVGNDKNPFRRYLNIKPKLITRNGIDKNDLLETINTLWKKVKSTQDFRNALLLQIQYDCGLRSAELLNLPINCLQGNFIKVVGKLTKSGLQERLVPISEDSKIKLFEYIKNHRPKAVEENLLFCSKNGRRIGTELHSQIFREQLKVSFTAYQLRHSFATHLFEAGASVEYISELMGHNHLNTLQIYLDENIERQVKIKREFHPLSNPEQFKMKDPYRKPVTLSGAKGKSK